MKRTILQALVIFAGLSSMLGASVAQAQGSALEYMGTADTRRATSPKDQAIGFLSRAQRQIAKAEKLAAEAAGQPAESKASQKAAAAYERAVKELGRALAKDSELREAHLLAGKCWLALFEPSKAESACHQAWALDPSMGDAPLCEAGAALLQNKVRRAQEIFLALKEKRLAEAPTLLDSLALWAGERAGELEATAVGSWVVQQRALLTETKP